MDSRRENVKPDRSFPRVLFVLMLAGTVTFSLARSSAQDNGKPAAAESAQSAAKGDGDYVGTEVCVTCHADQEKSFVHTIMGNAMAHPRTPLDKLGCEACHGPGRAHVEAGGGKDTIPVRFTKDSTTPVEERNAACLSCHTKGNQMFWRGSPHESRAMACVDCHQVHYGSPAERYAELVFCRLALRHASHRARRSPRSRNRNCACSATRCGGRSCSAPRTCRIARARSPAPVATTRMAVRTRANCFKARSTRTASAAIPSAGVHFCGSILRSWRTAPTATSRTAAAIPNC